MDNRVYWIWLQNAFGAGSPKPAQLVRRMGSAEKLYLGGTRLWSSFTFVTDKELAALNAYGAEQAEAALEYYLKLGQTVVTPDDEDYPALLKEIYAPPAVLYVQGDLSVLFDATAIGIVGTRKASQNGLNAAREIAYGFALKNAVVISGGALGIDSEAHKGALNGRGKTVAVLPCGLEYPYLMDNAILRREIVDRGGALVTEYPMHTPVQRGAFQVRNRLISGMAHGVLIAEAPKKSGALITAKHALEQNREVFVYIGEDEKAFAGCIALENDGAARVYTADDILKPFASRRRQEHIETLSRTAEHIVRVTRVRPKVAVLSDHKDGMKEPEKPAETAENATPKQKEPANSPENELLQSVSNDAAAVYGVLNDTPKHASELELEVKMPASRILAALTELELFGLIKTYPGQRFTKA